MQTEILTEALTSTSSKLSPSEKTKNLAIAKTIPFAETNTKLKKYEIQPENQKAGSMWQLLMALRDCELKNDA